MKARSVALICFVLCSILCSCDTRIEDKKVERDSEVIEIKIYRIDTSRVAVLEFERWMHYDTSLSAAGPLSGEDVKNIEDILKACISTYNEELKIKDESKEWYDDYKIHDLDKYYRQYIPLINDKGELIIWVNGFCDLFGSDGDGWKTNLVEVMDGGNCYFNMMINLNTGHCYDISVNGYA